MEDGTLIHPGDKITVTKNTTLRAVYTKNPKTETITYHYNFEGSTDTYTDDNGGKGYPRNTTATVKSLEDVTFTAPTGYEFLGWATKPDSNTVTYKVGATVFIDANGDNDLYAVWQVKTYTVTWVNWDNKELEKDKDVPYGADPEYDGDTPTKAADAQYTYTFKDWTPEVKTVTGDATYQATYTKEANSYTLTYDLDGGEWTEATNEFPYEYKATVEVIKTVPTREGYKFSGWRSEEVTIENLSLIHI